MAKIRILLIEDNRILREGITAIINGQGDITVAAASDGRDNALTKARAAKPHVVLMDLGLDSQNSLDVVESVKKEFPGVKIIGMGLAPGQSDILEFVQAGAEGFILKDAKVEDVIKTIRVVAGGETVLPPPMTGSLFSQVAEHALSKGKRNGAIRMTQREKEIIALIVEGMSNKQIADRLHIATFTVKSHVHNILEKLALGSRLQIANYARDEKNLWEGFKRNSALPKMRPGNKFEKFKKSVDHLKKSNVNLMRLQKSLSKKKKNPNGISVKAKTSLRRRQADLSNKERVHIDFDLRPRNSSNRNGR